MGEVLPGADSASFRVAKPEHPLAEGSLTATAEFLARTMMARPDLDEQARRSVLEAIEACHFLIAVGRDDAFWRLLLLVTPGRAPFTVRPFRDLPAHWARPPSRPRRARAPRAVATG